MCENLVYCMVFLLVCVTYFVNAERDRDNNKNLQLISIIPLFVGAVKVRNIIVVDVKIIPIVSFCV